MPDKPPEPAPTAKQEEAARDNLTGYAGLVAVLLKFVSGLSNERMLLLVVLFAFGYGQYYQVETQREQGMTQARTHEESREKDRRHCDMLIQRIEEKHAEREKEAQSFYAAQLDIQRKHDDERLDRDRRASQDSSQQIITKLSMILAKLMDPRP